MHSECVDDAAYYYFNYKVVILSHHGISQRFCSFLPAFDAGHFNSSHFNSSHVLHSLNISASLPIPCMQASLTYYSHSQHMCPTAKYHKNNFPHRHWLNSGLAGISEYLVSSMITVITVITVAHIQRNFFTVSLAMTFAGVSKHTAQWLGG